MFELKITSLNQAVSLSRKWATYTISLLDPGIEGYESIKIPVASHGQKLRRYYFNDITPSEIIVSTDILIEFLKKKTIGRYI